MFILIFQYSLLCSPLYTTTWLRIDSLFFLGLHRNIVSFQISLQNLKKFLLRFNQYGCISSLNFLLSLTSLAFFNLKYIATTAFHTKLDFLTKDCYLKQVSKLKNSNKVHFKTFLLIRPKNTKPFNKGRYMANFAPLKWKTNALHYKWW